MTKVNCIRCGGEVEIDISKACDENAEVFSVHIVVSNLDILISNGYS